MVSIANRLSDLRKLETRVGHHFDDPTLLEQALTHRSFSYEARETGTEDGTSPDYEGLEFLGDSILGFLISEFLFRTYPFYSEGTLSKIKAFLVSAGQLSRLSQELSLGDFLRLSRGEEKTGGRKKRAILADLFESVTAAIYLDGGIQAARDFVLTRLLPLTDRLSEGNLDFKDFKSSLQEYLHALGLPAPNYRVVGEVGPDHKKVFVVEVFVEDRCLGQARGRSKKQAQQSAAQLALRELHNTS